MVPLVILACLVLPSTSSVPEVERKPQRNLLNRRKLGTSRWSNFQLDSSFSNTVRPHLPEKEDIAFLGLAAKKNEKKQMKTNAKTGPTTNEPLNKVIVAAIEEYCSGKPIISLVELTNKDVPLFEGTINTLFVQTIIVKSKSEKIKKGIIETYQYVDEFSAPRFGNLNHSFQTSLSKCFVF